MHSLILMSMCVIALMSAGVKANPVPNGVDDSAYPPSGYALIEKGSDEFNTDGPVDQNRYTFDLGDGTMFGLNPGWNNNEVQWYTDSTENAFVKDGLLHIVTKKNASGTWTSSRITTRGKFFEKYYRLDVKARMSNKEHGFFPAIWMLPELNEQQPDGTWGTKNGKWPQSGEIDLMEYRWDMTSSEKMGIMSSAHNDDTAKGLDSIHNRKVPNIDPMEWHVYSVDWQPDYLQFSVDNNVTYTYTNQDGPFPYDTPFHILINQAVYPGWMNYDPQAESTFLIDWIRVSGKMQ